MNKNYNRRDMLKGGLAGGLAVVALPLAAASFVIEEAESSKPYALPRHDIELEIERWFEEHSHARRVGHPWPNLVVSSQDMPQWEHKAHSNLYDHGNSLIVQYRYYRPSSKLLEELERNLHTDDQGNKYLAFRVKAHASIAKGKFFIC